MTMSACREYEPLIEAFADAELPADQLEALESHLAECDGCSAYQSEMTRLDGLFDAVSLPQDAPDVREAVVSAIRRRFLRRFALVAAAIMLIKCLDVLDVFGDGAVGRLIVAAGAVLLFALLEVNPFRIVQPEELPAMPVSQEGANHGKP
jgi:anti-sigma factor RsiW